VARALIFFAAFFGAIVVPQLGSLRLTLPVSPVDALRQPIRF